MWKFRGELLEMKKTSGWYSFLTIVYIGYPFEKICYCIYIFQNIWCLEHSFQVVFDVYFSIEVTIVQKFEEIIFEMYLVEHSHCVIALHMDKRCQKNAYSFYQQSGVFEWLAATACALAKFAKLHFLWYIIRDHFM